MKHYGDISQLRGRDLPVVDVITGGSPCQDLSFAGKREGLSGARSGLFMEQIRIIKEMREHDRANGTPDDRIRPRYMVWENVPGALSSPGRKNGEDYTGKDFQVVLTEIVRIVCQNAPDVPVPKQGGGLTPDASWDMETTDNRFPSRGEYTTQSFGESPRDAVECRLSEILEDSVPPKYVLSAKASAGILKRAEKRGKQLPTRLKEALERQATQ